MQFREFKEATSSSSMKPSFTMLSGYNGAYFIALASLFSSLTAVMIAVGPAPAWHVYLVYVTFLDLPLHTNCKTKTDGSFTLCLPAKHSESVSLY